jgi:hypothetical protein
MLKTSTDLDAFSLISSTWTCLNKFDSILFGIKDGMNIIIHLVDPAFTGIGCMSDFLITTESNQYECEAATLDSKSPLPDASNKQAWIFRTGRANM